MSHSLPQFSRRRSKRSRVEVPPIPVKLDLETRWRVAVPEDYIQTIPPHRLQDMGIVASVVVLGNPSISDDDLWKVMKDITVEHTSMIGRYIALQGLEKQQHMKHHVLLWGTVIANLKKHALTNRQAQEIVSGLRVASMATFREVWRNRNNNRTNPDTEKRINMSAAIGMLYNAQLLGLQDAQLCLETIDDLTDYEKIQALHCLLREAGQQMCIGPNRSYMRGLSKRLEQSAMHIDACFPAQVIPKVRASLQDTHQRLNSYLSTMPFSPSASQEHRRIWGSYPY
ncbi:hypothetical protein K474DRAFT_975930 [Panus rudis PR-1116 ss-1]|nr:hypothetical protein K474DRAFT_975930 [Panus rudis PR-1116 ss-1]